jgi:hypothetical protein
MRGCFHAHVFQSVYFSAWASHMFTFATWEGMYCMFPRSSLQRKESVLFDRGQEGVGVRHATKLADCGMKFVSRKSFGDDDEFQRRRSAGDTSTLRVGFSGTSGIKFNFTPFTLVFEKESVELRRLL